MGKGKGSIQTWALPLKKGSHFFFYNSSNNSIIKKNLNFLKKKLPIKYTIEYCQQELIELKSTSQVSFMFVY